MASFEEQIQIYHELARQIADLEEKKRELSQTILKQMPEKVVSLSGCVVRRYDRLSIRTPIEKARELGATKTEEVLDKEQLKKLYQSGVEVPGVAVTSFIQVSMKKEASLDSSKLE